MKLSGSPIKSFPFDNFQGNVSQAYLQAMRALQDKIKDDHWKLQSL